MYSLDVNFLKDRYLKKEAKEGQQKVTKKIDLGQQFPLIAGLAAMVLLPSFAWGWLMTINAQKAEAERKVQDLDAQINRLNAQRARITELEQQLAQVSDIPNAIVSVLNQVKPMSVILQDLRQLIPEGVEVQSIQQNAPTPPGENAEFPTIGLSLSGIGRSYDDVNDFLLTLQGSDFVKPESTKLQSAEETELSVQWSNPELLKKANIEVKIPKVVRYNITTELNNVPASQLIRSLENRGAVGLVTWLRTLENKEFKQLLETTQGGNQ